MLAQSCTHPDAAPFPNLSAERGDFGKDAFYKFPPAVHIPYRNNSTYKSHFPLIPSKKPYKVASDLAFKCEVDLHTLKGLTCFLGGLGAGSTLVPSYGVCVTSSAAVKLVDALNITGSPT